MSYKDSSINFIEAVFELLDCAKAMPKVTWSTRLEKPLDNKYTLIVTDGVIEICETSEDGSVYTVCAWVKRYSSHCIGRLLDKYLTLLDEDKEEQ